jgi:hypothetical protein
MRTATSWTALGFFAGPIDKDSAGFGTHQYQQFIHHFYLEDAVTQRNVAEALGTASLSFAPGFFEVMQSSTVSSMNFFKNLPTDFAKKWAVYAVVMERNNDQPRLYIDVQSVRVHQDIAWPLMPHLRTGIRFLWREVVDRPTVSRCILAQEMDGVG